MLEVNTTSELEGVKTVYNKPRERLVFFLAFKDGGRDQCTSEFPLKKTEGLVFVSTHELSCGIQ